MATQLQSYKKNLWRDFGKQGKTPDFTKFPNLRAHWSEFVKYKMSEEGAAASAEAKRKSEKNVYPHTLGPGGYMKAIQKWERMELELLKRGIRPATFGWSDRSKQWFYAHGGALDPLTGDLIYNQRIRDVAERLVKAIEDATSGSFVPNRENDELTRALQNP